MLAYETTLAIILSLSIAFFIVIFITFHLWRGHRRRVKRETMRARGRRNHGGAQVSKGKVTAYEPEGYQAGAYLRLP